MHDAYTELAFERRLVLGEGEVRARFLQMSRTRHPDAGGDAGGYQRLAEAAAILESPSRRLRHWGELMGTPLASGIGTMDADLITMFQRVAAQVAAAREARQARAGATTGMGRALAERRVCAVQEAVAGDMAHLQALWQAALATLEELAQTSAPATASLASLAARFAYLEKWRRELHAAQASLLGFTDSGLHHD